MKKNVKEATTKSYAGVDAMAAIEKDPRFGSLTGDAKVDLKQKLKTGGTVELEEDNTDHEGKMAKSQMYKMKEYVDKLSMMIDDGTQLPAWVQSKLTKASDYMSAVFHYLDYENVSSQNDLMENMGTHRKKSMLMESAMKRLFKMFDGGMTDEEVVQDHATKGVEIPVAFISKLRKQWEFLKKSKLELEMGEQEYKNVARDIVNNPVGTEGIETGMEPREGKQLASGI